MFILCVSKRKIKMKFLQLIRYQNLLLIAFTQVVIRYFLVRPILLNADFDLLFTTGQFSLLVISTMLIAAAGYIINDYFDSGIDAINKPNKLFVGSYITTNQALTLHTVLSVTGIFLGLYLGAKVGIYKLALIQAVTVGLLWFYSAEFKRQFLIGNILISLLTAIVPLLVVIFEMPLFIANFRNTIVENKEAFLLNKNIPLGMMNNINAIWIFVGAFALFAFLITLIREIVKDMEDYAGDFAFGRKTIPVKLGIKVSNIILYSISATTLFLLGFLMQKQIVVHDYFSSGYIAVFIVLPLLFIVYKVYKAAIVKDYSFISLFTKVVMFTGVCYCFLFNWLMK
jgi:4-hydroxybenzoate polyprenyltransferase